MPESSLDAVLLPTLRGEEIADAEERLLAADPSGAEAVLLHLSRIAAREAEIDDDPLDRLVAWAQGGEDPEAAALVARSGLLAEQLEARLEDAGRGAGERMAAAGGAEGPPAWPAEYAGGPWRLLLALDEADRLFAARLAGPSGPCTLLMAGVVPLGLPDGGEPGILGPAEELLGGPAEFNPWIDVALRDERGDVHALRRSDP